MNDTFLLPLHSQYIGFIGLGNMGLPMARNLMAKGHKLVVYDTEKGQVEAAVADGAVAATGPSDVAKQSTTICTMLPARLAYNLSIVQLIREA